MKYNKRRHGFMAQEFDAPTIYARFTTTDTIIETLFTIQMM